MPALRPPKRSRRPPSYRQGSSAWTRTPARSKWEKPPTSRSSKGIRRGTSAICARRESSCSTVSSWMPMRCEPQPASRAGLNSRSRSGARRRVCSISLCSKQKMPRDAELAADADEEGERAQPRNRKGVGGDMDGPRPEIDVGAADDGRVVHAGNDADEYQRREHHQVFDGIIMRRLHALCPRRERLWVRRVAQRIGESADHDLIEDIRYPQQRRHNGYPSEIFEFQGHRVPPDPAAAARRSRGNFLSWRRRVCVTGAVVHARFISLRD